MPTLPHLDRAALVLAGVGAATGVALALVGVLSAAGPTAVAVPALPPASAVPAPAVAHPMADMGEAVRRPLFAEGRRPPPPKPVQPPPSTLAQPPDLQVVGIIAGTSSGVATGTDKRAQKPFRLRTGDTLGEWQVEAITRTSLRLRHADQVQDYPLVTPPPLAPSPHPR
ncbi:hypothetical protein [Nitrospirillum pindoramense]|uniref:General secretion pathway protein N n=1 Tax=Nitrospirillum amazonense TaxID=28077 RepID=A0A560GYC1_9PROT|nr:hypothetical protein [Nitrospirillum amazonense]TWB39018.1 hypothetical protein FBZ90_11113 [Nitrospirillum amazonense]